MAVEGYFHTRSFKKYILRMLLFAVLSEIPFDLMYGGTWFYPVHQNVLWTFLLSLLGVWLMEQVRKICWCAFWLCRQVWYWELFAWWITTGPVF